ncbi:MAG: SH3 domain-containing protein [Clostridiales bacterium]|nr:SH3 domain-containing protein [Clostridiales bacterium]
MKKIIYVVISLLLIAAMILPIAASAEITKAEVTKGTVIRSKADSKSTKIKNVKAKEQYTYVGKSGDWYEIRLDDNTRGYLAKNTAKLVKSKSIPTGSAKTAFAAISAATNQKSNFVKELPETFTGKVVIGVFTDRNGKPIELSTDKLKEEGSYRSIPEELLAKNMKEADWALMVYPVVRKSEDNPYSILVFPVNMKKAVLYSPYYISNRKTVLENGETSFELDDTLSSIEESVIYPRIKSKVEMLNDEDYQAGLQYMKNKKYYSAYESFGYSDLKEASEKAKQCVQKWPKTGEIYHNKSLKCAKNMKLTVEVNADSNRATLVRIYKGSTLASCLFIRGSGKATTKSLPAGTYVIKKGMGTQWFGLKEAFGRYGTYWTCINYSNGSKKWNLSRGSWKMSPASSDTSGTSVGSESEDWENFNQ